MKPYLTRLFLLIGGLFISGYLIFFGFCHGWWLQNNMWTHYFWMCHCGAEFEQSLYVEGVQVVLSACQESPGGNLSPDGRYLTYTTDQPKPNQRYVIDLVTGQKRTETYDVSNYLGEFWTDKLYLATDAQKKWWLIDITNGEILNLTVFEISRQKPTTIPPEAIRVFQQAHKILTQSDGTPFLALAPEPEQKNAMNYLLQYPMDGYGEPKEPIEATFAQHHITYTVVTHCKGYGLIKCPSHNGRWLASPAIISTQAGQTIVDASVIINPGAFRDSQRFIGWAHDDSGIYLGLGSAWIMGEPGLLDLKLLPEIRMHGATVIKVNLPSDYLQDDTRK